MGILQQEVSSDVQRQKMLEVKATGAQMSPSSEPFPMDLSAYAKVSVDPFSTEKLSDEQRKALKANIQLCRDTVVFFTAMGGASGYGGHTGGAYDMMPEVCLLDSFFRACPDKFVPTLFDEAGHRSGTQYLFNVLKGNMDANKLLGYRAGHSGLPGHPELGGLPGIEFSSGRLGHMWAHLNGLARAQPGRAVCCFGSDGSQMEGNNAEAARMAVANNFNVKLFIDDNDVTIAGHPSQYFKGYNVGKTLQGHGVSCVDVDGEDLDALYTAMRRALTTDGPFAVVIKRKMCPGVKDVEGTCGGHDAMATAPAVKYLGERGYPKAVEMLKAVPKTKDPFPQYLGCGAFGAARTVFGEAVVSVLKKLPTAEERRAKVVAIDSDLEGSCGMQKIREGCPEVYIKSGIMERANFAACAGFSFSSDMTSEKQGVFGTFAAFQEMILSEVTMARLNHCNVLCHFSHSGVDDMSDNMCHFGQNNFFADSGLQEENTPKTQLFFPADVHQMRKTVEKVFWHKGLRFVYSTRAKCPEILKEDGSPFFGDGYEFQLGKDDVIRGAGETCDGYVVAYSDSLYRSLDAVMRLRAEGLKVGLVNKSHGNACDEETMRLIGRSKFVLVVESQNTQTGLGVRFGTWLLERGLSPRYARIGTHKDGSGGTWEQAYHQGYDSKSVMEKIREMASSVTSKL